MKITEKIHLLKLDFKITLSNEKKLPRFVNVLIIFGDKITLIDTGVKGCEGKIFSYIKENNRSISEIETIVLSHSHPDHIGSAAKIKELTNCEILAHEAEINWIGNIDLQNKERPVPGFFNLVDHSVNIDGTLHDGMLFQVDKDITLRMIHSPGHSKGSLNIYFVEDNILFTADSIPLKNDIPNYDNYFDLMKSLEKIKNDKDYDILLTSWTPPLTDKVEITKTIDEGFEYMLKLDKAVKETYVGIEKEPFEFCSLAIKKLGLPPFLATPVVDKAFNSHLINCDR